LKKLIDRQSIDYRNPYSWIWSNQIIDTLIQQEDKHIDFKFIGVLH